MEKIKKFEAKKCTKPHTKSWVKLVFEGNAIGLIDSSADDKSSDCSLKLHFIDY